MKKEIVIDGNLYRLVEEKEWADLPPSYEEVCDILMSDGYYYITSRGNISYYKGESARYHYNNSPSKTQIEALLALNKLTNVARFVNGDWKCNINDFYFTIQLNNDNILIEEWTKLRVSFIGILEFKSREAAERAVEILGEEEIKKCFRLQE